MISISQKKEIVEQILKTKSFSESSVYQNLLRYLVESSIKGASPKETDIAVDVFDKDESFDPVQDTLVRVHIYKLRKKLTNYYNGEGKNDKIRLSIPKGHYYVEFIKHSSPLLSVKSKLKHPVLLLLILLFIFIISTLYFGYKYFTISGNNYKSYRPIWSDFLNNDNPTYIVLGDRFIFNETLDQFKKSRRIRDEAINSIDDLEEFEDQYLKDHDIIGIPSHGNLPISTPWCLSELLPLFFKTKYSIKLCTNIEWSDLSENNTIYIGDFKSLKIFEHFFDNMKLKYQYLPDKIHVIADMGDTLTTHTKIDSSAGHLHGRYAYREDYAIVAKLPGSDRKSILMFTGFSFVSQVESVKYFTDPTKIDQLTQLMKKKFNHVPQYFEILFKVEGYRRTSLKTSVVELFDIKDINYLSIPEK